MNYINLPVGKGFYVYQLLSNGNVVYVGQTTNALARIGTHSTGPMQFDDIKISTCSTRADMMRLERELIETIRPKHNKQYNPDVERLSYAPLVVNRDGSRSSSRVERAA